MSEVRGENMSEIRAGEGSTSRRQDFEVGRGGLVKGKIFRYYLPLKTVSEPVLRIRIHRIHMFLGLPDPYSEVPVPMDPDSAPDPSVIMQK
jgi:hypothetical protein